MARRWTAAYHVSTELGEPAHFSFFLEHGLLAQ